jgi:hypothetical protein
MLLVTKDEEELDRIGPLLGDGLRAWKKVFIDPSWPYYLVQFSTKEGNDWKSYTFFSASEVDLAGFCYSVANNATQRIEEITQLVIRRSNAQQSSELSTIGEIWEGEEALEGETGGTTVLLLDNKGKSIGSDPRSVENIRIRAKCYPISEANLTATTPL